MESFTATGQEPHSKIYQDASDPWCTFTYDHNNAFRKDSIPLGNQTFSTSPLNILGMPSGWPTRMSRPLPGLQQYHANPVCPRLPPERSGEAGRAPPSPTGSTPNTPFLTHSWTDSRPASNLGTPLDNRPLTPQDPSSGFEWPTQPTIEETLSVHEAYLPTQDAWLPQSFPQDSLGLATESVAHMSDNGFPLNDFQYFDGLGSFGLHGSQLSLDPRDLNTGNASTDYTEAVDPMTFDVNVESQASHQTDDRSANLSSPHGVEVSAAMETIDSPTTFGAQSSAFGLQGDARSSFFHVPPSKPQLEAHTHSGFLTSSPQPAQASSPARIPLRESSRYQCQYCRDSFDSVAKCKKHEKKIHVRPYPCIFSAYGCTEDAFGTQNEWARHIRVQHLRLEVWRCDLGDCDQYALDQEDHLPAASRRSNEYGRKDLFLEHVRRIHSSQDVRPNRAKEEERKDYMKALAERHHQTLRSLPPRSHCPCCPGKLWTEFDGRLHHMARAMEQDAKKRVFFHDEELEGWMIEQGLLEHLGGDQWRLEGADGKKGGRQARRRQTSTIDVAASTDAVVDADAEADDDDDYHGEDQYIIGREENQARRQTRAAGDRGGQRNLRRQRKQQRRIQSKSAGSHESRIQHDADYGNETGPSSTYQMSLRSRDHGQN